MLVNRLTFECVHAKSWNEVTTGINFSFFSSYFSFWTTNIIMSDTVSCELWEELHADSDNCVAHSPSL